VIFTWTCTGFHQPPALCTSLPGYSSPSSLLYISSFYFDFLYKHYYISLSSPGQDRIFPQKSLVPDGWYRMARQIYPVILTARYKYPAEGWK